MMTETILQMPCLECEPPCPWPVDPPKVIEVRVFSLFTLVCPQCILLNTLYLPEFTSKFVGPNFVVCQYEQPFTIPLCTIVFARLGITFFVATQELFMSFGLFNISNIGLFTWNVFLQPPESLTNGPFELAPATGNIQCVTIAQPTNVRAI